MKKILPLLIIFLFIKPVSAQYTDSTQYYTGLTASGSYNRTNANSNYLFNNALKLGARKKSMRYNFYNKWLYGRQNEVLTNNDFLSTFDVNLYKTLPHFYYWGLANYASSYSLKINDQYQGGLGIAYNIIDRNTKAINISDGFIYEYSDITLSDSSNEKYSTIRNSLRLQVKWDIGSLLVFNGNIFYQPSLQYGNDYIIRSGLSAGVKIKKWLTLTAALNYNKMSRTRTENLFVNYGIIIEKYY